jgi:hypothetical protein
MAFTSDQIAFVSLFVSLGSLGATLASSFWTKEEVRQQLKLTKDQLDEMRRQFLAQNLPDIQIELVTRLNPPEKAGVYLRATNHHPTITVSDLRVYAIGDDPRKKEAYNLMFLTFGDLKPQQTIEALSVTALSRLMKDHFPDFHPDGGTTSDTPSPGDPFVDFPLKLYFSYTPRFQGAEKVSGTREMWFSVMRAKGT